MLRARSIAPEELAGRFYLNVRICIHNATEVFSGDLRALLDTGAQRSILPLDLFDRVCRDGVQLASSKVERPTTIRTSTGTAIADQYHARIGILLRARRLLLQDGYVVLAVPRRQAEVPELAIAADTAPPHMILGMDVLADLRARLNARYAPSEPTPRARCRILVRGVPHGARPRA